MKKLRNVINHVKRNKKNYQDIATGAVIGTGLGLIWYAGAKWGVHEGVRQTVRTLEKVVSEDPNTYLRVVPEALEQISTTPVRFNDVSEVFDLVVMSAPKLAA